MKVYALKELVEILDITAQTLGRMIKRGELKATKIAGKWRITQEELDRLTKGE